MMLSLIFYNHVFLNFLVHAAVTPYNRLHWATHNHAIRQSVIALSVDKVDRNIIAQDAKGAFGWALGMRFPREIRGFSFVGVGKGRAFHFFCSHSNLFFVIHHHQEQQPSSFLKLNNKTIKKTIIDQEYLITMDKKLLMLVDETETSLQLQRSWSH